jgi:hypothetical protein
VYFTRAIPKQVKLSNPRPPRKTGEKKNLIIKQKRKQTYKQPEGARRLLSLREGGGRISNCRMSKPDKLAKVHQNHERER